MSRWSLEITINNNDNKFKNKKNYKSKRNK